METYSRREFSKKLLIASTSLISVVQSPYFLFSRHAQGSVVLAQGESLKRVRSSVLKERVIPYLNQAVMQITGVKTAVAAWKALVSPGERVGIKLSCLPGLALSSSYGLVMAIVEGLLSAGVKEKNILIWERTERELSRAGFILSRAGVQVRGTDSYEGDGYAEDIEYAHSVGTRFSRILYEVDALINVPVLKDHDLCGVSISMKNFYGAIYNPNKFHRSHCDPYVAELNSHPLIKEKLRLIVCDASRIQVQNGPAYFPTYAVEYGALLVSRDPVALDYQGWQIIERERARLKLPTLREADREPRYIFTAERLGLGSSSGPCVRI